jgi:hypothetical protein
MNDWSPERIAAHNARIAAEAGRLKRGEHTPAPEVPVPPAPPEPKSPEDALNKTEKRFLAILKARGHKRIGIQSLTLKLAFDCRYTPDFWTEQDGKITFWEIKGGFEREDAAIKIKMAAAQFPFFTFVKAVEIDRSWTESTVNQ